MPASPITSDVVLLPSLGRPATDFDSLANSLRMAGFRCHPIEPRREWTPEPTFARIADDVVARLDEAGIVRAHIIGHAFGNRLARMVTARHPTRVDALVLLACGGYVEMDDDVAASLLACFDPTLAPAVHLEHVRKAFFAGDNDASVWAGGWMPKVAAYQRAAVRKAHRADWWDATASRVLVIQAMQDAVAVPDNGRRYAADHPEVTLLEIQGAGHAMLPEQPRRIASEVLQFLNVTS